MSYTGPFTQIALYIYVLYIRMKLASEKRRSKQRNEGRKDRSKEIKQGRKERKQARKQGRKE